MEAHAREQLLHVLGLDHVVISADGERSGLLNRIGHSGQHDDGHLFGGEVAAQRQEELEGIAIPHDQRLKDDGGQELVGDLESPTRINTGGDLHIRVVGEERGHDMTGHPRFIDHEDLDDMLGGHGELAGTLPHRAALLRALYVIAQPG